MDEAIRRRLNLIPFTVTIPAAERDPDLAEKLKAEWPGILQWMIDGCLDWQAKRLAPPQAVTRATDDYLEAEDALGQWIAECCDVQQFLWARSSELFASWREWAERAGEYAGSRKRFSQALEARGFRPKRQPGTGRTGFEGLAPVRGLTPAGAGENPTG